MCQSKSLVFYIIMEHLYTYSFMQLSDKWKQQKKNRSGTDQRLQLMFTLNNRMGGKS